MYKAVEEATKLRMDCLQVFTKNQRQWKVKPLVQEEIELWKLQLQQRGWQDTNRIVSHNSYLINLASPDTLMHKKSVHLQRDELERCETLNIPLLVTHPGARLGAPRKRGEPNNLGDSPTSEELDGLKRIVDALDQIHFDLSGYTTITCLETTVGSGTNLGYDFHHLAWIKNHVQAPERVAYCFDTCHVTAAGYDMSTKAKASDVLEKFDTCAGLDQIKVLHFNDSVGGIGSRLDRHAHIGNGCCGLSCFMAILEHPLFDDVPKILETSKEENSKGTPMDKINIAKLRRMANAAKKRR